MLVRPEDLALTARSRDRVLAAAEERLEEAVGEALQRFLARARTEFRDVLTAAGPPLPAAWLGLFEVGQMQGWWEEELERGTLDAVRGTWQAGRSATTDLPQSRRSLDEAGEYLANVRDRLSRTATPTIPDQAFNIVRTSIAAEMALGSDTATISRRIAADLQWQGTDTVFWEGRLSTLDDVIDRRLDGLGPQFVPDPDRPGRMMENPVRREARLNDPEIGALQAQRRQAVSALDADRTTWQMRAERIARTESTGAYNAGAQTALLEEGAGAKMWLATGDARTRMSHLLASGECVPTSEPFVVGGVTMMMPGDPSAPAEEVINCRCTIIGGRDCEELAGISERTRARVDEQREERGLDPAAPQQTTEALVAPPVEREFDAQGRPKLTPEEMAEAKRIEGFDVMRNPQHADELEQILRTLPDGAEFSLDRFNAHGKPLDDLLCRTSGQRLFVVERGPLGVDLKTARRILDDGIAETVGAIPGGTSGNQLLAVVWSPSPYQNVRGLASSRMISIHGDGDLSNYATILRAGTVRHEVGHSMAHAASRRSVALAVEALEQSTEIVARVQAVTPPWIETYLKAEMASTGRPLVGTRFYYDRLSGPRILDEAWLGPRVGPEWAQAQKEVRAFVKARNAALKQIDDALVAIADQSAFLPGDLRIYASRVIAGDPAPFQTTFVAPQSFRVAAELDADRLIANRARNAERYAGAKWDDPNNWQVSLEGRHRWNPDPILRPTAGVTEYASSVGGGIEDWAEAWRLYVLDRQTGRIGRTASGVEIRFADLFPARAVAIEDWATTMGYDLSTLGRFGP